MHYKNSIKSIVGKVDLLGEMHRKYRRWEQDRAIKSEQNEYEVKTHEMGLDFDEMNSNVKKYLDRRLNQRGIHTKPKSKGELHIVYASGVSPWDIGNIVPGLEKYARVTVFDIRDYGYDSSHRDWVKIRDGMNRKFYDYLVELHEKDPIDVLLTYYSGYQISPECIDSIGDLGIVTGSFHWDDRLLFKGYKMGGRWTGPAAVASSYDFNLTQAPESLIKYWVEGGIPLLWPLAADQSLCYPRDIEFKYDVTFAGSAYGNRISLVDYLLRHDVKVETFGQGWKTGFVPADKFPEIYCSSRINLNFDEIGYSNFQCGKLRDFEVPMCGGLMLSTNNPHLGEYFKIGEEIFTFDSKEDCLEKIKFLLANEKICEEARKKARDRALREHKWEDRAAFLLRNIGCI